MPLPIIANVFRVALRWNGGSGALSAVNVMHFRGPGSGETADDLRSALNTNVTQAMWNMSGSSAAIGQFDITPLDGVSATKTYTPVTPSHWQGATGGDVSPQTAGILKFTTANRGRSHRGRMFMPFPAESQTAFGQYVDGTPTTAANAWNIFAAAMLANSPSFVLVVASYKLESAQVVTGIHGELSTGTQRRRNTRARIST